MSKNKLLVAMIGMLLVTGAWTLSSNVEVGLGVDALAVTDNGSISVACTDPTAAAFMPDLAYTVTWSAPAAAAAATPSVGIVLTGPVNGDSNPSGTATLNGSGAAAGFVVLTNLTPTMKMGGLQCQTSASAVTISGNGDGSDNTSFDIAVSNLADSDTGYTGGDKVDAVGAGTPVVLFGTAGQISTTTPTDGAASDADGAVNNGEVVAGTAEATGGSELHSVIDVTNYNPSAGTDVEAITFTLTGA